MRGNRTLAGKSALIFDLDGTLVDSTAIHCAAFRQVFDQYGIKKFDYGRYQGHRTEDVITDVFSEAQISVDADIVKLATAQKQKTAREAIGRTLSAVPGAVEFLKRASRANFKLAIGTGASKRGAEASLKAAQLDSFFEVIVTVNDVTQGKPAPDIFLRAAELLDVPKENCLVFEDSISGFLAARAAEIDVVILESASFDFPEIVENVPVFNYRELLNAIETSKITG